jgi:DNA mismatch repair protein MutS2
MDDRTLRVLEFDRIISMLAQLTVSTMGMELAFKLKPSVDETTISKLLDETSEAESVITSLGSSPLSAFPDIRNILRRAGIGAILSIAELIDIGKVLTVCRRVKQELEGKKNLESLYVVPRVVSGIRLHDALSREISRCIESEDRISDKASPTLANIRRQITRCGEKVKDRLSNIISSTQFQKYLQEPIVTIRNGRYVVPVKQEYRSSVSGLIHDQSSSGATVFIEPMSVVEANNELREWKLKEDHEIEKILAELSAQVGSSSQSLYDSLENLSMLDFILAKAKLSISMAAVRPKLIASHKFNIVNGRHPLIDKSLVVPINIRLGNDFRILIITGPNTGGKTVTLKTAGLFLLMTQSGLNIPAGIDTEIGIYEKIYADIGDEQSIEQNLSTFSSHMSNIVPMINEADPKTLLLFDELGAGTDPVEGAALAMSILDHLNEKKVSVMATTHYSELKAFALIRSGMENASTEFDVETLRPTYRLFIGIPGRSNAFEISRRLGLNENLIDKAKDFVSRENMRFDEIIRSIEYNRLMTLHEREETKKELEAAKSLKSMYEAKETQLEEKRDMILRKARDEAKEILHEAKDRSEELIKEIKQLAAEQDMKQRNVIIEESRRKFKESLHKTDESLPKKADKALSLATPKNLRMGETVYIVNLDQYGYVLAPPDQNDEVLVQVGIIKVNVHISNLKRVKEKVLKEAIPSQKIIINNKIASSEISVRGQKLEEALLNVDKYIDDALLSGFHEVTIIHGKGQGILRNGIHEMLRAHPQVESFRLGIYGEGDWGVTIVSLGNKRR